ncbi:MAG: type II toxin-antitoxin system RelE/ParE family toxin [Desulfobacterales bacterium]|nr:type II toxin-antitoxin system RelE/ParE family toxin [Deltaproteobacteria bacterium]NNK95061.1 type II toxin-antitoxin system RelE/ParE family toxin [Desulfobacterales bacterium]
MPYHVKITAFANKIGKTFSPEIKKTAKNALKELAQNPNLGKELQAELSGLRAHRFMRYRIVYKVDAENKNVVVWAIGHRRDIYENLGGHLLGLSAKSK